MIVDAWNRILAVIALGALVGSGLGCETSALGRRQLKLMPESQMSEMGVAAFAEMSASTPVTTDANATQRVVCVANALTSSLSGPAPAGGWEVKVFADDSANAFALPGGKIGVHTGLLKVAKTQDQLAAVIGHEIAHVQAGHSNERMSAALATQAGLSAVEAMTDATSASHSTMMSVLGMGAQVGILLPYGRSHESEADLMGLDIMAKAGFDPRQSIDLWKNMAAAGGEQPAEFLSTHPSHATRIADLEQRIPSAMPIYQSALQAGRQPHCF